MFYTHLVSPLRRFFLKALKAIRASFLGWQVANSPSVGVPVPSTSGNLSYDVIGVVHDPDQEFFLNFEEPCMSMNSMKLVIPLHSLYWSIHTKDESKRGTAFAFIFGVN